MYWYCGQLIKSTTLTLDVDDPGLIYGATVFTTIRVYQSCINHRLTSWHAHCFRLKSTLETFDWKQPNWLSIRQGAEILSQNFPVIRITVFPDGREWITGRFLPENLAERQNHGIMVAVGDVRWNRSLPEHKTGNYLAPWLAKTNAQSLKAQEVILVDNQGNWLETATGNLWGWKDHCWWTPPLTEGILPGIERSLIIGHLQKNQIPVKQEPWTGNLVKNLEAIAYSNSVVEIVPIYMVQDCQERLEYNPRHSCFWEIKRLFLS